MINVTMLLRRLRSQESKGALALIFGSAISQIVTIAVTPVLTRVYSPGDFGFLSLVLAVASIVTPAAALRLDSAIMLVKPMRDVTALLVSGIVSALLISATSVGVLQILFAFGMLQNMATLDWFSVWVATIVFLTAVFTLVGQFALRMHQYRLVSRRSVYQSIVAAVAQLGVGLVHPSALSLIGGYALGRVAGIVPVFRAIRGHMTRFHWSDVQRLLRLYWRFPLVFAPSSALNAAGLFLPVLFVGVWFSVADAGKWAVAERLVAAPIVLVATAIGQVVEVRMAEITRERQGGLAVYYTRVSFFLALIGMGLAAVVILFGPWAVELFLGPDWGTVGELLIAFTPMLATRMVASPMSKILLVLQHSSWNLALDVARVVLMLAAIFVVTSTSLDLVAAAWCTSGALSVAYVATWALGWSLSRRSASDDR